MVVIVYPVQIYQSIWLRIDVGERERKRERETESEREREQCERSEQAEQQEVDL